MRFNSIIKKNIIQKITKKMVICDLSIILFLLDTFVIF